MHRSSRQSKTRRRSRRRASVAYGSRAWRIRCSSERSRGVILASLREVGSAFRGFQPDGAAAALDALADERTEDPQVFAIRRGENTAMTDMASKSISPPAALAVSLAGGLALGVLTNLAQGWLPGAWNQIANSGAVWAAVAFVVGAALAGRCRLPTIAAAGLCVEIGLVAGYCGYAVLVRHDDVGSLLGWPVLWAAFACVAGPLFAVAAVWWPARPDRVAPCRRPRGTRRPLRSGGPPLRDCAALCGPGMGVRCGRTRRVAIGAARRTDSHPGRRRGAHSDRLRRSVRALGLL